MIRRDDGEVLFSFNTLTPRRRAHLSRRYEGCSSHAVVTMAAFTGFNYAKVSLHLYEALSFATESHFPIIRRRGHYFTLTQFLNTH